MVSSLFLYLYIFLFIFIISSGENRSSGRTGPCGSEGKAGTCSFNNSNFIYLYQFYYEGPSRVV